ncbi:hypothetical protein HNP92_000543 [Methanococcus maripaludis]|jgi:hypothetical protein|uniref:Uncharacterized protein n=4 Tax=Methanococcus maripaludis TaxID=39152 RepID=A0A2L1CBS4_METMI|nr:hypothetical protein [Methanococcus maripaludis]AEK20422.1 hypothetical protein GYY_07840 [Methanococcus maripaludis X1]MDK2929199.1 hypothetical protein [Methanococcus sp.]BAP61743.1 hypothetical protein MMKA1_16260 [Methanococcus maripaludis KA1]AVB76815.1 hypothetical protein MMJJ_14370 [Methanococcus maripaludis]MBA2868170.1 hypothetical protein [Methanococcus maripaludis]
MINYINKFKQIKKAIDYMDDRGYSINVKHENNPVIEIGNKKTNPIIKNTIGNVKVHYINTAKLLLKMRD